MLFFPPSVGVLALGLRADDADTARDALRGGRLLLALALAVVVTGLGAYARVLPGLREG